MSGDASDKKTPTKRKASDRGLGRGLSALMSDIAPQQEEKQPPKTSSNSPAADTPETPDLNSRRVQFLSIDKLERNPDQPRRYFDKEKLSELTESIRTKGVLQPILVRPLSKQNDSRFQIVAGERRWQAATAA